MAAMVDRSVCRTAVSVDPYRLIALVLVGCATACGTLSLSPSDVVVAAYHEANAGRFSQADAYLTGDLKSVESQDGGSRLVWRVNTRNQSLTPISPTRTDTNGDSSTVAATLVFSDGCRRVAQVQLHRDWDGWHISRIGGDPAQPYPRCEGPAPGT
jgi:hypothetical protein